MDDNLRRFSFFMYRYAYGYIINNNWESYSYSNWQNAARDLLYEKLHGYLSVHYIGTIELYLKGTKYAKCDLA
jgi:hypothetical protein